MFFPDSYTIIISLFPRLIGVIYFFALSSLIFQIIGLIGKNGILPIKNFLNLYRSLSRFKKFQYLPTLFWINSSDKAILGLVIIGTALSICLIAGIYPSLILLLLYVIHLSIVTAGQDFLSFGWEGLLLEITAQAFFLSLSPAPNLIMWISINFLLFRFHFLSGILKLQTRDPNWRNLTAIAYHYQTQPIPNTIAWYMYKLPLWFQKVSTALVLFIEIIVPFGIFFNEEIRIGVFICLFGLQFFIWLTGNFSYLNLMTAIFTTILIGNKFLSSVISSSIIPESQFSIFDWALSFLGVVFIILQCLKLCEQLFYSRHIVKLFRAISSFHLFNRHAIFANMTTKRYEVVIEGSDDGILWKEYNFKYKPSEITGRPRRIAPFQPRIDWQAWFLPFRNFESEPWFQSFLFHLLKGTPEVLKLLRENPFQNHPPKYIRSLLYDYEFSTAEEKKTNGWWWHRELLGEYGPVVALKQAV
ncbi:MAG: lipase maturation factor family protein [Parachlamydiaceae bacterium]|nr:lipase maturation factor family protein [Parachlamydiaceae bacterium]